MMAYDEGRLMHLYIFLCDYHMLESHSGRLHSPCKREEEIPPCVRITPGAPLADTPNFDFYFNLSSSIRWFCEGRTWPLWHFRILPEMNGAWWAHLNIPPLTMIRWSNAYDVGLRNRKMGVGIPRESPKIKIYKKGIREYDNYTRRND